MKTHGLTRTKLGLAVLGLVIPIAASAAIPYEIETKFRDAGCRIVTAQKVARTDLDAQRVYVAWCSAVDVYLMVVKCKGRLCRVVG